MITNWVYHKFLCALTGEGPCEFFILEDNCIEEESSDSDDVNENYDGYHSEVAISLNGWICLSTYDRDVFNIYPHILHNEVVMVYLMIITGLVIVLEFIFIPYFFAPVKGDFELKVVQSIQRESINVSKLRWVHTKGFCNPRDIISAPALKIDASAEQKEKMLPFMLHFFFFCILSNITKHLTMLLLQQIG